MGMQIILQSLVLVSKIAQFKSYAAGLRRLYDWQCIPPIIQTSVNLPSFNLHFVS